MNCNKNFRYSHANVLLKCCVFGIKCIERELKNRNKIYNHHHIKIPQKVITPQSIFCI